MQEKPQLTPKHREYWRGLILLHISWILLALLLLIVFGKHLPGALILGVLFGLILGNVFSVACLISQTSRGIVWAVETVNFLFFPLGTLVSLLTFWLLAQDDVRSLFDWNERDEENSAEQGNDGESARES